METDFGQVGYDAYRDFTGGVSLVSGSPIPEWDQLPKNIQDAWRAAGEAVLAVPRA